MPIVKNLLSHLKAKTIGFIQEPQRAIMNLHEELSFSTEVKLPRNLKQRQPLEATRPHFSSSEDMPDLAKLNIKRRSFATRRIWQPCVCSARLLPSNNDKLAVALSFELETNDGLRLQHQSVKPILVPKNATIYRTLSRTRPYSFGIFVKEVPLVYLSGRDETECQRFMSKLRKLLRPRHYSRPDHSFEVSMIDNKHSRSAGLTALYGDMLVTRSGIFVKDTHDGALLVFLEWSQIHGAKVIHPATTDGDLDNLVHVRTTRLFNSGEGELAIFCEDGERLARQIRNLGRAVREFRMRPLSFSLSESNLTSSPGQKRSLSRNPKKVKTFDIVRTKVDESKKIIKAPAWDLILNRSESEVKLNKNKSDFVPFPNLRIKPISPPSVTSSCEELEETAPRFDSNVTTPSGIPSSNLISPHSVTSSCEELEKTTTISRSKELEKTSTKSRCEELEKTSTISRRDSNVSMCSGIYEEIAESHLGSVLSLESRRSHVYENLVDSILNSSEKLEPPPLPPRSRTISNSTTSTYACGSVSDSGFESEGCILPYNDENYLSTPEDKSPSRSIKSRNAPRDTSEYVPMMPRTPQMIMQDKQKKRTQKTSSESIYVAMR